MPGNVVSKWQYDAAGKPVHHLVRNGQQTTRNRKYHWGINDQLKRVTNQLTGAYTSFGYDECCNLVQSQDEWLNSLYRNVDDVGNLFETKDKSDRIYGAGSRLLQTNVDTKELRNEFQGGYGKLVTKGTMYAYDAEGNLIQKTEPDGSLWQYEYFGNGMLSKVIKPDKTEVTFKYDSLGRRIEKCSDSKVIKFVWDGNTPLHEWQEAEQIAPYVNESFVTWLFDDGFVPVVKLTNEGNYSIISDYLGTPVEAYDEDGKSVWSTELDIYGRVKTCIGKEGFVPFRYQGQYADSEIGLYYNRFRYYSPDDGGYTQQDPIGLAGGNPTLYGYVRDTNSWIDIYGLKLIQVFHYTSKKGYNIISSQNPFVFKANAPTCGNPGGVYLTNKSPEILAQTKNGFKKLGLTGDKSSHFFEFTIDDSKLKPLRGDRGDFILRHEGDLTVQRADTSRHGKVPCK